MSIRELKIRVFALLGNFALAVANLCSASQFSSPENCTSGEGCFPDQWEQTRTIEAAESVRWVAWSPDGSKFASAGGTRFIGEHGYIEIWNPETEARIAGWPAQSVVQVVSWSPDGSKLATVGGGNVARLWDAASGELIGTLSHSAGLFVGWSPDGSLLATGAHNDGSVRIWDAKSLSLVRSWVAHGGGVGLLTADWSPDGARLVTGGEFDSLVKIWDVATGNLEQTLVGHSNWIYQVAWSPDGSTIASGSKDTTVKLWDSRTGALLRTLPEFEAIVVSIGWSTDSTMIAASGNRPAILIWDVSGQPLRWLTWDINHYAWSVAWRPNECMLVSGTSWVLDGYNTMRVWSNP